MSREKEEIKVKPFWYSDIWIFPKLITVITTLDKDGNIKVIDEIHTPDSSRLWVAETYESRTKAGDAPEMLDKEVVRRYLMDKGFKGEGEVPEVPNQVLAELAEVYLGVAEGLMGEALSVEVAQQPPMPN